jgi:hypothetical protein
MMRRIWLHAWLPAADSPSEAEFIWTVRNVGIDRVLLARTVQALEKLDLSDEEKAGIQSENARRLFGVQRGAIPAHQ